MQPDVIQQGADMLGWDLNKLFEQSILAMRSCEETVRETMEKKKERPEGPKTGGAGP